MSLLAVVYKSLLLFSVFFTVVLIVSYISYKVKQRGGLIAKLHYNKTNLKTNVLNGREEVIPKNNTIANGTTPSVKNDRAIKLDRQPTKSSSNPNGINNRFHRLETLHDEVEVLGSSPNRHPGDFQKKLNKIDKFYNLEVTPLGEYKLSPESVFNYYDEQSDNDFYLFKTKH